MNLVETNFVKVSHVSTGHVNCCVLETEPLDIHQSLYEFSQNNSRRKPGGFECSELQRENEINLPGTILLACLSDLDPRVVQTGFDLSYALYGPFSDFGMRQSLPHVIYNLGEPLRQNQMKMVTIHAAAMTSPEGMGVLILGDKGVGKTTTSLMLGYEHGYELIGNDLVIIQENNKHPRIVSGSQLVDVRVASISNNKKLCQIMGIESDQMVLHNREDKITITPEKIGVKTSDKPHEIGLIVRVSSHPEINSTSTTNVTSPLVERLRLNENMSRYIRGIVTPLSVTNQHIAGYFPSLDTETLVKMRNRFIDTLLNKCKFKYISASNSSQIADQIDQEMKNI